MNSKNYIAFSEVLKMGFMQTVNYDPRRKHALKL